IALGGDHTRRGGAAGFGCRAATRRAGGDRAGRGRAVDLVDRRRHRPGRRGRPQGVAARGGGRGDGGGAPGHRQTHTGQARPAGGAGHRGGGVGGGQVDRVGDGDGAAA